MRYIFVDTETGGLDPNTSLLSIGYIITDNKLDEIFSSEIFLKPDNRSTWETFVSYQVLDLTTGSGSTENIAD